VLAFRLLPALLPAAWPRHIPAPGLLLLVTRGGSSWMPSRRARSSSTERWARSCTSAAFSTTRASRSSASRSRTSSGRSTRTTSARAPRCWRRTPSAPTRCASRSTASRAR
jgi:hypothetical protein